MKKGYVKIIGIEAIVLLIISGCKKEAEENYLSGYLNDACRLVSSISEFGDYSYTYNQWGLLDQYKPYYYDGYFKMDITQEGGWLNQDYIQMIIR